MERLGIGFEFDVHRFGGKEFEGTFEKALMLVEYVVEFLIFLQP
jgi:hypothetical protein